MKQKRHTVQKGIVIETFESMHNHPSAGMVYNAVHEKSPEISKATVYRILGDAADDGDVLRLKFSEGDDRFDITTKRHYHITCKACGAVADVEVLFDDSMILASTVPCEGFSVEDFNIEFYGYCQNCKK